MINAVRTVDPRLIFGIIVPDWRPEDATPFQGFAPSLAEKARLIAMIACLPTDVFEPTPQLRAARLGRRIAGRAPVNWYGQSPRAIRSHPFPLEAAFSFICIDDSEKAADYKDWLASCEAPVTLVAQKGGHLTPNELTWDTIQPRLIEICDVLITRGDVENADVLRESVATWEKPEERRLSYEVGGNGTIHPNLAALTICGFTGLPNEGFRRFHEGETAHVEQIGLTAASVLDEREANPPSAANQIFPRTPDINLYCPATYDLKSTFKLRDDIDRKSKRDLETVLRLIERQSGYSYDLTTQAQVRSLIGFGADADTDIHAAEFAPRQHPVMGIRQRELWLGTAAVCSLAASEIGSVIRLPNRANRVRGVVRQFAQHYRADRPQIAKRGELFRGVQRALSDAFPAPFQDLLERSRDGIRIIADAHLEWLDVRGVPLGLRYNVSRIPVTPGNAFIDFLATRAPIVASLEDFRDILIVSGLDANDVIAKHFEVAFEMFGKNWRDKLRLTWVRVRSRKELVDAINGFTGMMMVFDGHGSHKPDDHAVLWLGGEPVDIWSLRGEIARIPPIVILSACDTHAADRNHATVANGFLALGARSVLSSVFPLQAADAAVFSARLLYRIADYVPAAVSMFGRAMSWLEVVSGMLRRQAATDILRQFATLGVDWDEETMPWILEMHAIMDFGLDDPFDHFLDALRERGFDDDDIKREVHKALAASSTISYLHMGRPETILINTPENLERLERAIGELDVADPATPEPGPH